MTWHFNLNVDLDIKVIFAAAESMQILCHMFCLVSSSVVYIRTSFVASCRPFFTYWVTFVQIVCYVVSVAVYGFSPVGISVKTVESEVFHITLYGSVCWFV